MFSLFFLGELELINTPLCTLFRQYTGGGFNFILFWNFNRNHTENDRYIGKKITFYFLQNV